MKIFAFLIGMFILLKYNIPIDRAGLKSIAVFKFLFIALLFFFLSFFIYLSQSSLWDCFICSMLMAHVGIFHIIDQSLKHWSTKPQGWKEGIFVLMVLSKCKFI